MIKLYDNKAVEVNGKMFSLMNDYNDYVCCWLEDLPSNYNKTTLDELTIEISFTRNVCFMTSIVKF